MATHNALVILGQLCLLSREYKTLSTVDFTSLGTRVDFAWERTPSVLYPIAMQSHDNHTAGLRAES